MKKRDPTIEFLYTDWANVFQVFMILWFVLRVCREKDHN